MLNVIKVLTPLPLLEFRLLDPKEQVSNHIPIAYPLIQYPFYEYIFSWKGIKTECMRLLVACFGLALACFSLLNIFVQPLSCTCLFHSFYYLSGVQIQK